METLVATTKNQGKYRHPNSKQIAPEIEKGMIDRCYLFLGEEEGEKENFIEKISTVFFGKDERVISRFHCEGGDLLAAVSFSMESSMFSAKKLAVIYNVEALSTKKDFSLIADIVNELSDSTQVIFTSTENNPPKAFSGEIGDSVRTVIFWRMFENELQNYILKKIRDAGRQADPYAATRIVSLTGRDLQKVNAAVERVLSGSEGPVTEKIVVSLIADEREINVFEFIDAFFKKRKDSFSLLKKVLDEGGSELGVIALMQREAERIESYHSLRTSGKAHEDAIAELKINPRNAESFTAMTLSSNIKKIRELFIFLSRADYAAKSSRQTNSILSNPLADLVAGFISQN